MRTTLIAQNIRSLLEEKGLKATPLSIEAGLSRMAISNILNGQSLSPKFSTLEAIAKAAGVDVRRITVGPLGSGLAPSERRLLHQISQLDDEKRLRLEAFLEGLSDPQR